MMDKRRALDAVVSALEQQLAQVTRAARETQAEATHEEARPENAKDTRALEQTYLARGQSARVEELTEELARLRTLTLQRFEEGVPAALTALVLLEDEEGTSRWHLLLPGAGGTKVTVDGNPVLVITPSTPLGEALVGRSVGDTIEVRVQGRLRERTVTRVA